LFLKYFQASISTFKVMNEKLFDGATTEYCLTPTQSGQANSAVVIKACNGTYDNQDFRVDSLGRLVNEKSGTCLSSKGNRLRVAICDAGDPASRFVYKTMDNALAIFSSESVYYLTPVDVGNPPGERGVRLRPRNYAKRAQKWAIVES